MDLFEMFNANFIDAQYEQWKADPNAVSSDWRFFFHGFELAGGQYGETAPVWDEKQALRQSGVHALISRYRNIGHLLACLDPLTSCPTDHPLLNLAETFLKTTKLRSRISSAFLKKPTADPSV